MIYWNAQIMEPSKKKNKGDWDDQYAIAQLTIVELSMMEAALLRYKRYMKKIGMSTIKSEMLLHKIGLLIEIAKK